MSVKRVAALVALVLCVALVVVALLSDRLPAWMMLVGGAGALVALRAVETQREKRCPNCRAHAGRVFRVEMSSGKRMNVPPGVPNAISKGPTETHYRCGACQNEWHVRVAR